MNKFIPIIIPLFLLCCSSDPIREGIIPDVQNVITEFDQVEKLTGKIIHSEWESTFLNESRSITTYLPPNYNQELEYGVLFVTDNSTIPLAPCVEYLITKNEIEPIIIVGINLREPQPIDSIFGDYLFDFRNMEFFADGGIFVQKKFDQKSLEKDQPRNAEFISDFDDNPELLIELGFAEIVSNRYVRFTSYIIHEVIPFVKKNYSVTQNVADWTLGGFSSGGAFVYNFTSDFPNLFGNAIVMSPAGPFDEYDFSNSTSRYFLAAGDQEMFLKESLNYIPEFEKLGIWFTHKTYDAGHDWQMWMTYYLDCIKYIYKK